MGWWDVDKSKMKKRDGKTWALGQ